MSYLIAATTHTTYSEIQTQSFDEGGLFEC